MVQSHRVEIKGYASGGEGVAKLEDGKAVFIRGAARGDVLDVGLTQQKPRSARAEILRVIKPSPYRVTPDCPAYPKCGGCDFRHITYEEELRAKLSRLNDALRRIGGLSANSVDNIISTGQINGYRNKAVFHSNGTKYGFYEHRSRKVVAIDRCLLLKDDINETIKSLTQLGDITVRSGKNGLSSPLEEELDGLVFKISGFFQVNTGAALLLYQQARKYAAMSRGEILLDLYCGVGSMTIFVGRDAGHALGVELNPEAIEAARENAGRNGFTHIDFIAADVSKWESSIKKADCIIADPPRSGLLPTAVKKIVQLAPRRIVYISCDPATMARDLRVFGECNYRVKEICAVDMFPRTANVECCCLLEKADV